MQVHLLNHTSLFIFPPLSFIFLNLFYTQQQTRTAAAEQTWIKAVIRLMLFMKVLIQRLHAGGFC